MPRVAAGSGPRRSGERSALHMSEQSVSIWLLDNMRITHLAPQGPESEHPRTQRCLFVGRRVRRGRGGVAVGKECALRGAH